MTRKNRIRLVLVLVVLGVPLVLASLIAFFTVTGRLGGWIGIEYARRMPGHLTVGTVQFAAADQVHLADLAIAEGFSAPLATIKSVDAQLDVFNGRLTKLTLHGVSVRLDGDSFDLLQRIIEAGDKMKPSNPPQVWDLVSDGEVEFASGLRLTRATAKGRISGSLFEIDGTCCIGDAPDAKRIRVFISSRPLGVVTPGAPLNKRLSVQLLSADLPVHEGLDAIASIDLLPPAPAALKRWLPKWVNFDGSVVHRDLSIFHFAAPILARWIDEQGRPGSLVADLDADANRITVAVSEFKDPAVGRVGDTGSTRVAASLGFDTQAKTLVFESPRFFPGPGIAIPAAVPVDALLKHAPRLKLTYAVRTEQTSVQLSSGEQSAAQLMAAWGPKTPLRIQADALPLTLAQGFMPVGVMIGGGQATHFELALDQSANHDWSGSTLRDLRLEVSQGRAAWRGWSLGPLDGTLVVTPQAEGSRFVATLPMGEMTLNGSLTAGTVAVRIQALDALLARLHGPVPLPTVSGTLEVDLAYAYNATSGTTVLTIPRAVLDHADVHYDGQDSLQGKDLLQGVKTTLKGQIRGGPDVAGGTLIAVKIGGQLTSGQLLLLSSGWLNLASYTPIFTVDAEIRPGTTTSLTLKELLARAADATGTPLPNGYSAQFSGTADENGNGTIAGVIDHADLGWMGKQAALPPGSVSGEGALTCTVQLVRFGFSQVIGSFLPLNADVQLGTKFRATGITGSVEVKLEQEAAPPVDNKLPATGP